MEIRTRIFEKYDGYKFKIPMREGDKVLIEAGPIKVGDLLLERSISPLKKTVNVPKVIGCKLEECGKYIVKVDGEYVEEGEVLAQRLSNGKLTITELVSPVNGVLDLSRIKEGYIDILGEESSSVIKSDFSGYINSVDPMDGLSITTNAVVIDGVVSSKSDEKVFGILEILGDGNTILTESSLKEDYRGKIVWVGPYLYNNVAVELFERGALGILTYAMSYIEFRNTGLPVMILGGFGSVHCDTQFIDRLKSFEGKFIILDSNENQIFLLSDSDIKNKKWFVNQYVNQEIISRSTPTYGYIGKVLEYDEDTQNILVDFKKRGQVLMNVGLVDFIDL